MRRACPLCAGRDGQPVWTRPEAEATRCANCRVSYLSWRDQGAERIPHETYEEIYRRPPWLDPLTRISYERLLDGFEKYRAEGRILDIGCGAGGFLAVAAERGWAAYGTEAATGGGALARRAGATVLIGERATESLDAGTFDVVTLFEVVEHVLLPLDVVREAYRVLRPDGMLYLTTPNGAGLQRRLLGRRWPVYHVEHLTYFDPATLRNALDRSGFHEITVSSKNFDPFRLVEALLACNSSRPLDPDSGSVPAARSTGSRSAQGRQALRRALKGNAAGRLIASALDRVIAAYDLGDTLAATAHRSENA